jgi:hypothetical protein
LASPWAEWMSARGRMRSLGWFPIVVGMDASGVSAALRTAGRGDLALAAGLLVGMALAGALSAGAGSGARAWSVVASFGLLALAWRRAHPVAALAVVLAVALVEVEIVPGTGAPPLFLALMVAVYSLAAYAMGWSLTGGLVDPRIR